MKKIIVALLVVALAVVAFSTVALADKDVTGNGAPSGPHYNLNIIGVKDKTADMTDSNRHVIFMPLWRKARIYLTEGEFKVLDGNGTDGRAEFQLPNPDPDNDGVTEYSVFARALGKPNGKAKMTTCATDPMTGEEVCSVHVLELERTRGKQKFENVSKYLLYIYAFVCTEVDPDTGVCLAWEYMRVPLFSDELEGYLWDYDNNGLKLAQLRFYPIATEVPEAEDWPPPE